MISDILTVMRKEIKEMFIQRPNFRGGWVGMLIFIGVFGVLMPAQLGEAWVESPAGLLYWVWVPFLLVSTIIADSFAGERERRTLETLLASRLSDKAILFGKLGAAILYGWGLSMIGLLLGLITVNVMARGERLLMFPALVFITITLLIFLVALFSASIGIFISLRAPTVRQAQQTMGIVGMLPLLPLLILPMLPGETQANLMGWIMNVEFTTVMLVGLGILLVVDALLLAGAMLRFQRARLILD